jgi:hypothetical protein
MMIVKFDDKGLFYRQMNNLVKYSHGFLEGAQKGKTAFLKTVGEGTKEILESFIDVNARVNPDVLHHVYEWYQAGSPEARLFEIEYTVSNLGLSLKSTFTQSKSIRDGSREPFYDKARIMENGVPVTIAPRRSGKLVFEIDGETIFTENPVRVDSPGGDSVRGGFERIFDMFFEKYFKQSFLQSSGMVRALSDVSLYKKNLASGLKGGHAPGLSAGYRWISNVRIDL